MRHTIGGSSTTHRLASAFGRAGGALGVAVGLVEVAVGSSIPSWIGDKNDPTRLGAVTITLSVIAFGAAAALNAGDAAGRRLALVLGMLVPGLVCFTTVGRLWYAPGVLLVVGAWSGAVALRAHGRLLARLAERHAWLLLASVLAVLYVALGVAAFGRAGAVGVAGGLLALIVLGLGCRLAAPLVFALLLVAAVPFAAADWWSVAVPVVGGLLVLMGTLARRGPPGRCSTDTVERANRSGPV